MLIIIEGADNTGKTTLARHLQKIFDLKYIHCGKPKTDDPYQEYADLANSIKEPTIIDRAHLGEYVYSKLWRGGCTLSDKQFQELDMMFMDRFDYVFLIHAVASVEQVTLRCQINREELLKEEEVEKCLELFDEIVSKSYLDTIKYDSSVQFPEDIEKIICQKMFVIS